MLCLIGSVKKSPSIKEENAPWDTEILRKEAKGNLKTPGMMSLKAERESDPKSKKFWSPILPPDWSIKEENAPWDTEILSKDTKGHLKTPGVSSLKAESESDTKSKKYWSPILAPDCPEPTSKTRRVVKKKWKGEIKTKFRTGDYLIFSAFNKKVLAYSWAGKPYEKSSDRGNFSKGIGDQSGGKVYHLSGPYINCNITFSKGMGNQSGGMVHNVSGTNNNCNLTFSKVSILSGKFVNCNITFNKGMGDQSGGKVPNLSGKFINCNITFNKGMGDQSGGKVPNLSGKFINCTFCKGMGDQSGGKVPNLSGKFINCTFCKGMSNQSGGKVHNLSGTYINCKVMDGGTSSKRLGDQSSGKVYNFDNNFSTIALNKHTFHFS